MLDVDAVRNGVDGNPDVDAGGQRGERDLLELIAVAWGTPATGRPENRDQLVPSRMRNPPA